MRVSGVIKAKKGFQTVKLLTESFPGIHQYLVPQKRLVPSGEPTKRFFRFSQSHERVKTFLWKPVPFLPLKTWCEVKPGENLEKFPKPGENLKKFPKTGENLVKTW